jgi:hypothetical protein
MMTRHIAMVCVCDPLLRCITHAGVALAYAHRLTRHHCWYCMYVDMEVDDQVVPAVEESDEKPRPPNTFIPGLHTLGKDEILEADESVYVMRHTMNTDWPCLSFDVLRDDDGDQRQRFPASAYIVAGTQADAATKNQLTVCKMTQLHKTQKDGGAFNLLFFLFSPQGPHCQRATTLTLRTTTTVITWMRTRSSNIAPSHTSAA